MKLFENAIQHHQEIIICGVILTEILQGISDTKEYKVVSASLAPFSFVEMTRETFILAADIFRKLRKKWITIRKTVDCLIAAVAIENNFLLLHHDKDFIPIEKYCDLKTLTLR